MHLDNIAKGNFCAYSPLFETDKPITSPPEQIFYIYWVECCQFRLVTLEPQYKVGSFYADFYVNCLDYFVNEWPSLPIEIYRAIEQDLPKILVEIDGHKWHEKSLDQVEADKQRERFFIAHGYTVIRFTAREVFKNPVACVMEILQDHCHKAIKAVIRDIVLQSGKFSLQTM